MRGRLPDETDVPKNIVGISVAADTDCCDVTAYLMLQFVQTFERFVLLSFGQAVQTNSTALNRKVVGKESKKNLLAVVC